MGGVVLGWGGGRSMVGSGKHFLDTSLREKSIHFHSDLAFFVAHFCCIFVNLYSG